MPPGVQVLDLNPETCGVSGRGSEGGFRVPGPVQLVGLQGIKGVPRVAPSKGTYCSQINTPSLPSATEEKRPIDYTGLTFMILATEEEKGK
ncbi:hypothetical protein NQZ68_036353 [Dissostichus eleginoides]|nr:hypothetical protein NQZ68_036353 [Dissostichus eleginoides]